MGYIFIHWPRARKMSSLEDENKTLKHKNDLLIKKITNGE